MDELREKISDIITNELFERFGSPSSAVIGVQLADRIMRLVDEEREEDHRSWVIDNETRQQ